MYAVLYLESSVVDPAFQVNSDPEIRIQGFDNKKLKEKKIQLKHFLVAFFDQKLQFTYPKASLKDVHARGEACRTLKRTSNTSKKEIY
jgi:hypothetical protein